MTPLDFVKHVILMREVQRAFFGHYPYKGMTGAVLVKYAKELERRVDKAAPDVLESLQGQGTLFPEDER